MQRRGEKSRSCNQFGDSNLQRNKINESLTLRV